MMISSESYTIEVIQTQSLNSITQRKSDMNFSKSQQGSTLISVLLILLVITVLGVMAMRQGLTTLNISTNAQVKQLLVQSSDAASNNFGRMDLAQMTASDNVIGLAVSDFLAGVVGQEYVFCFRPESTKSYANSLDSITIKAGTGDTPAVIGNSGGAGFCDLSVDFGSARKAVVTQVAITVPTDDDVNGKPGDFLPRETNATLGQPNPTVTTQRIRATSTSMLPAFASSPLSTVQDTCLGNTSGTSAGRIHDNTDPSLANRETLTDCLARYGVPSNTQVTEFNLVSTLVQITAP